MVFKDGKTLILDGATGTGLANFIYEGDPLWASRMNLTHRAEVKNLHKQYLLSGAEIISANTFRTNPVSLKRANERSDDISFLDNAFRVLYDLKQDYNFLIAGVNPPAEDSYTRRRNVSRKELEENHYTHIMRLMDKGADFILNETMSHIDEIEICGEICETNKIPYVMSLYFEEGKILSGEKLGKIIEILNSSNTEAISFNCVKFEDLKFLDELNIKIRKGFYPNAGTSDVRSGKIKEVLSPEKFAENLAAFIDESTAFAGGCCGTTPGHIKELKEVLVEKGYN
ncbi:MAG: homocysteine S-methyltransferase family protein [Ignavibacteriaceae bacterium]|nr:homocysteine S-methyltransferase family protein [Ignavibacteriaceae bacterium]